MLEEEPLKNNNSNSKYSDYKEILKKGVNILDLSQGRKLGYSLADYKKRQEALARKEAEEYFAIYKNKKPFIIKVFQKFFPF